MRTERTDVTETAESVGGNDTGSGRQGVVLGCWVIGGDKGCESDELVGDDLDTDKTADEEDVLALARYTEEECDGVEDVAEDELQSKVVLAIEVDVASPPSQKTVNHVQERNDTQKRRNDHTGDLKTEPSTVGKCVERVRCLVLLVVWNHNAAGGQSLLLFGVTKLAESERGGDTHNAR